MLLLMIKNIIKKLNQGQETTELSFVVVLVTHHIITALQLQIQPSVIRGVSECVCVVCCFHDKHCTGSKLAGGLVSNIIAL